MAKQFTLGKQERLKSRKQIEKLFDQGKSFVIKPYRIYYMADHVSQTNESNKNLQFGVGVSAKNFRRAVDRNSIKRLTREAWRLQKNTLASQLKYSGKKIDVFFIYIDKDMPEFNQVKEKVAVVLKKLEDKLNENNTPDS